MIVVREAVAADAAGIARVHVDSWRTTYTGIMPAAYLSSLSYQERERMWDGWLSSAASGERVVGVAEETTEGDADARRIVGFASGGAATRETRRLSPAYDGELHMIYLLESHQGRGVGRRLFRFVAERLAAGGARSLFVWVARDNPSRRFYGALGGRQQAETRMEIFGQTIDEAGYGWEDLGQLLAWLAAPRSPGASPPDPE